MKRKARLVCVDNNRTVTRSSDSAFWYQYQNSVLLALKQAGTLTEMQYRCAEDKLTEQHRALVRTKMHRNGGKNLD